MSKTDKRKAILEAVEKVFRNRRFDEVTLDEIAAVARVGKGTIYLYFEDKEDLFLQMVQERLRGQYAAVEAIVFSGEAVRDKLIALAASASELIQRHHCAFKLLHSPEFAPQRPGAREIMVQYHEQIDGLLEGVFREGIEQGGLRADLDTAEATCLFRGLILSRNLRALHGGGTFALDRLVDLLMQGIQNAG